jgi:hypothetical protein
MMKDSVTANHAPQIKRKRMSSKMKSFLIFKSPYSPFFKGGNEFLDPRFHGDDELKARDD